MKRTSFVVACLCAAAAGRCQLPDVGVFADLRPTLRFGTDEKPLIRWMDHDGKMSVVGLRFFLENGVRVKISQRMQRVPGDDDPLDEYWLNLNNEWQVGKQYLPFGRRALLRESVLAASFNTSIVFDAMPAEVAVFDSGEGWGRGVSARLGRKNAGVSLAVGDHIGIQGSSLSPFREPGEAPGKGRGWSTAYGADASFSLGPVSATAEVLLLRQPTLAKDPEMDLSDVRATASVPGLPLSLEAAWSRSWKDSYDAFRLGATAPLSEKASLRPLLRFDRSGFKDFSVTCIVRL